MDQQQKNRIAPLEVFVSYADGDEKWRDALLKHLHLLQHEGLINTWHRGNISIGMDQKQEIKQHLEKSSVMLSLISPNFLKSTSCYEGEMHYALGRNDISLIPIVVSSCDWEHSPIADLQYLPRSGDPIKTYKNQDAEWIEVIAEIRKSIGKSLSSSANTFVSSTLSERSKIPFKRNHFFTGRKYEMDQLNTQFWQNSIPTVGQIQAISGLGGVGKTELVIEYVYRHLNDYDVVLWAQADNPETLKSSYTEIATQLNLQEKDTSDQDIIVQAVKTWLKNTLKYLLILDNASEPEVLRQFLPLVVGGHLLITTQIADSSVWNLDIPQPLPLTDFTLQQGVDFLRHFFRQSACETDLTKAEQLVRTLGGLPLALDHASAYILQTQSSIASYLDSYEKESFQLLQNSDSKRSHTPVATTITLSFNKVIKDSQAAADLLLLCAFLAHDAIPEAIFKQGAKELSSELAQAAANDHQFNRAIKVLRDYSLIDRRSDKLTVHCLVQDVLRNSLSIKDQQIWKQRAIRALCASLPRWEHSEWARCEEWLLHATTCAKWIEDEEVLLQMPLLIASHVLDWIGCYLQERARFAEARPFLLRGQTLAEREHRDAFLALSNSRNNLACLHWKQGEYEKAKELFLLAQGMHERRLSKERTSVEENLLYAESLQNLACVSQSQGTYKEARELFLHALKIGKHTDERTRATIQSNLAELYRRLGEYTEAESLLKQALKVYKKQQTSEDLERAYIFHKQALLSFDQGKYEKAKMLYNRTLKIYERYQGQNHFNTAQILHGLAEVYRIQRRYGEAETLFLNARSILKHTLGEHHSSTASVMNGLALLYLEQGKYLYVEEKGQKGYMQDGRYEEARKLFEDALKIRGDCLGWKHSDTALSLYNLALFYYVQGEYKEAEWRFERALEIWRQQLPFEHPSLAHTLYYLGHLAQAQKNYEKAEDFFQKVLRIQKYLFGQGHSETILRLDDLAFLYYDQKKYEKAEEFFQRILTVYEECLGAEHPETQAILGNFISFLQTAGRDIEVLRFPSQIDEDISDENL